MDLGDNPDLYGNALREYLKNGGKIKISKELHDLMLQLESESIYYKSYW